MFEKSGKCGSVCQENVCQLKQGHRGKHRDDREGLSMWTDGGTARLLREQQEAQQKSVQQ
jgi:hypothetical protein